MRPKPTLCIVALLFTALLAGVSAADPDTTAVVDRTGDDFAVLLYEDDGETAEQRLVDLDDLPEEARYEGAVVQRTDGGYEYDEEASEERRTSNEDRFDDLSERL